MMANTSSFLPTHTAVRNKLIVYPERVAVRGLRVFCGAGDLNFGNCPNANPSSFLRRQESILIFVNLLKKKKNQNGPLPSQG